MVDGNLREIIPASSNGNPLQSSLIVTLDFQFDLFREKLPHLLVDIKLDIDLQNKLLALAQNKSTNIRTLSAPLLVLLMPQIFPIHWKSKESIKFPWDEEGNLLEGEMDQSFNLELFQGFWAILGSLCSQPEYLLLFEEWPIVPTKGNVCRRLSRGSPVIEDGSWSESLLNLFSSTGVAVIHIEVLGACPPRNLLQQIVEPASASGVLSALGQVLFPPSSGAENVVSQFSSQNKIMEKFQNLTSVEKRELRGFLLQSKWFTGPESLDQGYLQTLKKLPVFETYVVSESGSFI